MQSQFLLLEITTGDSTSTRPRFNIDRTIVESSASRAALRFMSMAFSGKKGNVKARVKVQNWAGNVRSFDVMRTPVTDKYGITKYKHHLV